MQDIVNKAILHSRIKEVEICNNIIETFGFNNYAEFREAGYRMEEEVEQLSQIKIIKNIVVYKVKECHRVQFVMKAEVVNNP